MTDKEILAELKRSYEYLQDIRDNGCIDHNNGQMARSIDKLEMAIHNIEDVYFDFYNTLDRDELRIKSLENNDNERVYIARNVDGDYEQYDYDIHDRTSFTCEDVDYYWYNKELGNSYNDYMYESIANGFMKALDEICVLSKETNKDFDYYDKTCELTGLSNFIALDLLDKFGSDNDDE